MSTEQKPIPPTELSLKFMSWSVKEGTEAKKETNRILDQKLSEIVNQLREIAKALVKHEASPF